MGKCSASPQLYTLFSVVGGAGLCACGWLLHPGFELQKHYFHKLTSVALEMAMLVNQSITLIHTEVSR